MDPAEQRQQYHKLAELIALSLEGHCSSEQTQYLHAILLESAQARKYYYDYIITYIGLNSPEILREMSPKPDTVNNYVSLYEELADTKEETLPVLLPRKRRGWKWRKKPIKQKSLDIAPVEPLYYRRSYFALKFFAACAAVFISILAFVYLNPRPLIQDVADIEDTFDIQWSQTVAVEDNLSRLNNAGFYSVLSGLIQIKFDSGTRAILEGPSVFQCNTANSLFLEQGKVFVDLSDGQGGFVVQTPSAKITDIGTQFGVLVKPGGEVEVQMIDGRAMLEVEHRGMEKQTYLLTAPQIKIIEPKTGAVQSVETENNLFVRSFSSSYDIIWRGELFSLADVVGGGNGLGAGAIGKSIDLMTGKLKSGIPHTSLVPWEENGIIKTFIPTPNVGYVDGVFVPRGNGPDVISSTGLTWQFPTTDGQYSWDVHYGLYSVNPSSPQRTVFMLNGKYIDLASHPAMCLHSNAGITYDLQKIRQGMSGVAITSFSSYCGIDREVLNYETAYKTTMETEERTRGKANIYVLVDGVKVFEKGTLDIDDNFIPISIDLKGNERFLTLAATNVEGASSFLSWVLWVDPSLMFTSVK